MWDKEGPIQQDPRFQEKEFLMKRVIALCLCAIVSQGCTTHRTSITHQRGFVLGPSYPQPGRQAPRDLEEEKLRIEKMEAVTDALWVTVAAARVALEIIRVVR